MNKELFFHRSRHGSSSPARGSVRDVQPLLPSGRRLTESVSLSPTPGISRAQGGTKVSAQSLKEQGRVTLPSASSHPDVSRT